MHAQRTFLWLIAVLLLVGCETLGIPKPESFKEKLAFGYATVTSVRQSATTLLTAKKISADDAQHVQDQANNARTGLDVARGLEKTDPKAADAKLTAIRTALTALQAYLVSREKS